MQLFFIDESGTPPALGAREPRYFVLGGVIVPEGQWTGLSNDLKRLKNEFGVHGEVKWRYFVPRNSDEGNPLRHLDAQQRDDFRSRMLALLPARKSIKIICAVASIAAAYEMASVNDPDDIYRLAYKVVTERFQYQLQDLSRQVGNVEHGIIVLDNRNDAKHDARMRDLHARLLSSGGDFVSKYMNLIEGLFIAPSHHSVGIQFADVVAGAVWRAYERHDDRFVKMIEPAFRRGSSGQIQGYGLVHTPKAGWR